MSQKPNIHSYLVPLNLFQLEDFPLKWRVLMAMSTAANAEGVAWVSAAKVCILLGEVNDDGSPSANGLKAVRASRQALTKSGILTYFTVIVDGEKQHRWRINLQAFKPGLASLISYKGTPVDRWAGEEGGSVASVEEAPKASKPPKPSKPSKASKVEEIQEEEGVIEDEEVQGPSAADLALRQAVLARARREAEEEAHREAEVEAAARLAPKGEALEEKSGFSWDMLGL